MWGEAMRPPWKDEVMGFLKDGRGVILATGWASQEQVEAAMRTGSVAEATKKIEAVVKKVVSYPVQFKVVERSKYEHSWCRLG